MGEPRGGKRGHSTSRSAHMVSDLLPEDGDRVPNTSSHVVPTWLLQEQAAHKRPDHPDALPKKKPPSGGAAPIESDAHGHGQGLSGHSHSRSVGSIAGSTHSSKSAKAAKGGKSTKSPSTKPANTKSAKNPDSSPPPKKDADMEGFVMVDLLDAAHVPHEKVQSPSKKDEKRGKDGKGKDVMSQATDSIISLPPMDSSSKTPDRWNTLKAQAQEARKGSRCSSFADGSRYASTTNLPPFVGAAGAAAPGISARPPQQRTSPTSGAAPASGGFSSRPPHAAGATPSGLPIPTSATRPPQPTGAPLAGSPPRRQRESIPANLPSFGSLGSNPATYSTPTKPVAGSSPAMQDVYTSAAKAARAARAATTEATKTAPTAAQLSAFAQQASDAAAQSFKTPFVSRVGTAASSSVGDGRGHHRTGSVQHQTPSGLVAHHQRQVSVPRDFILDAGAIDEVVEKMYPNNSCPVSGQSGAGSTGGTSTGRSKRKNKNRGASATAKVYPHSWEWRRPADEDVLIPDGAWIYLAFIGWFSFAMAYIVNQAAAFLSGPVLASATSLAVHLLGPSVKVYALALIRAIFLSLSFWSVLKLSPKFTTGSGIPEMKCVLSGVFMPAALSEWTLVGKVIGLIFALASGISIGRLGPFIHVAGICASLISRLPMFPVLVSSARFQLQAVSCAMAAGVGATFGAPIGGTLLAIEMMSTYYFIHWLPMALYCSIMGYYLIAVLAYTDSQAYFSATVSIGIQDESVLKLLTYAALGVLCGLVGAFLVQYTIFLFQVRNRFFGQQTVVRTTIFCAVFAAFHSLLISKFGGVLDGGQRHGVVALFNEESSSTKSWISHSFTLFDDGPLSTPFSLFLATGIKFFLTGVSLVMPVPAGTFMPIFEIGALLGRGFGELLMPIKFVTWVDPRATAIIAAAGVASGTLHTTSIAVVMLEITREAVDILPLALCVIVSYGVSKSLCTDLFSELIKVRRLPFILGLRERYPQENRDFYERVALVSASTFMAADFPFVTPQTTVGEIRNLLSPRGSKKYPAWSSCAFLSNSTDRHLWGTISRAILSEIVKSHLRPHYGVAPGLSRPPSTASMEGIFGKSPSTNFADVVKEKNAYGTFGGEDNSSGSGGNVNHGESPEIGVDSAQNQELVPMLRDFSTKIGHRNVDMGPMVVSSKAPFWKVSTYFRMLGMSSMYVVEDGSTVGFLTKAQVINFTFNEEDRAEEERKEHAREQRRLTEYRALARGASIGSARSTPGAGSVHHGRLAGQFSQMDLQEMAYASRSRGGPQRSSGQSQTHRR